MFGAAVINILLLEEPRKGTMSIVVLHDGYRKKIAVTAGTPMSDVLKKACEGFGLSNMEKFELRHKESLVDLSLPFRLSGVSVNAVVELREVKGGAAQSVRVCIQQADGQRQQGNFSPSKTLQDILLELNVSMDNSLNYMRRELKPSEFSLLTLQTLGLLSGSVMFRTQSQSVSSTSIAQPVAAPAPPATTKETKEVSPSPPKPVVALPASLVQSPSPSTLDDVNMLDDASEDIPLLSSYDAIQLVRNRCFDAVSKELVLTLMKIVCNLLSNPDEAKYRSIRVSNPKFTESVGKHIGGMAFLHSIGFAMDESKTHLVLANETTSALRLSLDVLHVEADDLGIDRMQRPVVVVPTAAPTEFDAFKPVITRVQAQPRGASITEIRLEDLKKKEQAILAVNIPPRMPRIYFPHEQLPAFSSGVPRGSGPSSDSQLLAHALRARQDEAEKNQSFRTSAMRELDEMQKKAVFQSTVLRIRFPDQVVLQATFHPNETIAAVVKLLHESLNDDVPAFYLYVTPPKQTLNLESTSTLTQLNLVPAALVYLAWFDPPQMRQVGAYFLDSVMEDLGAESKESSDATDGTLYPVARSLTNKPGNKMAVSSVAAEPKSATKSKTSKPGWLKL
ncbi:Aste57867_10017 [Aphanomyces stellatus]|uniref:Aste57867_10017 protein n=1 Tax=Aphanomyces stellatus TaxID=120398 RepID=A0A485KPD5_9STRA|nr:hypothetical protein As57867_009978 [Aphanomyces stellatus]VFT86895.1 Aste57867_10017 [Aphanomyces stellatus]